ncbi:MAG: 50S ribosomal protein L9 [Spirochaetaceae bacterium]
MKVILNSDVPSLGEEGDIRDVAPGYARNFLIPRGMVLPYSRQNLALVESRRATIEKRKEEKRRHAQSAKERLENEPLVIRMTAGERGKLFGSVTTGTIAGELEKRGIEVERKKIDVEGSTIKTLGTHTVGVRLYGEEEAQLKVVVEPDEKSTVRPESKPGTRPTEAESAESSEEGAEQQGAAAEAAKSTEIGDEAVSEEPDSV